MLLVFTNSEHTDAHFSSDTVKMETRNFFYYGHYLQRLLIATGKDLGTVPTSVSCDWHYQHREALCGFENSTIWWLQIWKEKATFFPKPCTQSLWVLSCSEIKACGKPNAANSQLFAELYFPTSSLTTCMWHKHGRSKKHWKSSHFPTSVIRSHV